MKYLVVAIVLAAIAGVEMLHAFSADDAPDALMCMAPQAKMEAFREMLLLASVQSLSARNHFRTR